ncbi:MAG: hypothetical protein LBQ48_03375 [Oscillospiraceae bacterium]|jgi:hypothetical protein|nr:hypothetical protein [Oscillospiraceae bacterium]
MRQSLNKLLDRLPVDQREVMRLLFWSNATHQTVTADMGIPLDRVRQLREKAMRELRRSKNKRELEEWADLRTNFYYRVGVESFHSHGYSAVEILTEKRMKLLGARDE